MLVFPSLTPEGRLDSLHSNLPGGLTKNAFFNISSPSTLSCPVLSYIVTTTRASKPHIGQQVTGSPSRVNPLGVYTCEQPSSFAKEPFLASHTLLCSSRSAPSLASFSPQCTLPLLVSLSSKLPSTCFTRHFPQWCWLSVHHLLFLKSAQCPPFWPGPPCCFTHTHKSKFYWHC